MPGSLPWSLGCGDGGPFLELARQGVDVEGVDSSKDMLARCHAKAAAEGLRIVTHCQRMEDLSLHRTFRSVYLAGPTFNLLPDDDSAQRALRSIARHLSPGGRALIPLWIPPATRSDDFGRTKRAVTEDSATVQYTVDSEEYDPHARTRRTRTTYRLTRGEIDEVAQREWIIHWHTPEGFRSLVLDAGFEIEDISTIEGGEFTARLRRP